MTLGHPPPILSPILQSYFNLINFVAGAKHRDCHKIQIDIESEHGTGNHKYDHTEDIKDKLENSFVSESICWIVSSASGHWWTVSTCRLASLPLHCWTDLIFLSI